MHDNTLNPDRPQVAASDRSFRADRPHANDELLRMVHSEDPAPIIQWVRARPRVAEIVLREANSMKHALLRRIETVDHAVAYLGSRGMARLADRMQAVDSHDKTVARQENSTQ